MRQREVRLWGVASELLLSDLHLLCKIEVFNLHSLAFLALKLLVMAHEPLKVGRPYTAKDYAALRGFVQARPHLLPTIQ